MDRQSTFDEALIGIAHTSLDGRCLLVNRRLCDLLGYSRDELTGLDFMRITPLEEAGHDREARAQLITGTLPRYTREARYRRKDGSLVSASLTVSLHRDTSGAPEYFIEIIEDLAERTRLEEQGRQAHRMEAIGRLAGGIAYDFNNLLTAIVGYADLALQQLDDDSPSVRADIEEIRAAGRSAAELTRQLLTFSRKQVVEPRIIDFNAVVEHTQRLLNRLIEAHIDIRWTLAPAGCISGDACQIEQMVVNLAVNARDAMPDGGVLTIETGAIDVDRAYAAAHPGTRIGPHVFLRVSDTGVGMDQVTREHLFEPFYTTKPTGTGLGMSTVHGIVMQSGGSIDVRSQVGEGTTVSVHLPRAAAMAGLSTLLSRE
jgi:PAS domain S-box-containing protein